MICKRCGTALIGKQTSYCSPYCAKLYLKSLWRKRNRERIAEYNREYRAKMPNQPLEANLIKEYRDRLGGKCERCQSTKNLHVHHMRPLEKGGENHIYNLALFCARCHSAWHKATASFFG